MKVCTFKIIHLGHRKSNNGPLENRSIHKEGGTPKAGEAQSSGALRVGWLFSRLGSLIHSHFQMEKKIAELVRNFAKLVLVGRSMCGLHALL